MKEKGIKNERRRRDSRSEKKMGRDKKNRRSTVGMGGFTTGAMGTMGSKRTVGNVGNNHINMDSGYVGMVVVVKNKKRTER